MICAAATTPHTITRLRCGGAEPTRNDDRLDTRSAVRALASARRREDRQVRDLSDLMFTIVTQGVTAIDLGRKRTADAARHLERTGDLRIEGMRVTLTPKGNDRIVRRLAATRATVSQ